MRAGRGLALVQRERELAAGRECRKQAIAKAEAARGNAARLVITPMLCLCERRDRRDLARGRFSSTAVIAGGRCTRVAGTPHGLTYPVSG